MDQRFLKDRTTLSGFRPKNRDHYPQKATDQPMGMTQKARQGLKLSVEHLDVQITTLLDKEKAMSKEHKERSRQTLVLAHQIECLSAIVHKASNNFGIVPHVLGTKKPSCHAKEQGGMADLMGYCSEQLEEMQEVIISMNNSHVDLKAGLKHLSKKLNSQQEGRNEGSDSLLDPALQGPDIEEWIKTIEVEEMSSTN